MALAIRFDGLIRRGDVANQAELARLGHVTRVYRAFVTAATVKKSPVLPETRAAGR